MTKLRKARAWVTDYVYMIRGSASMLVHKNPPAHYLGYIIEGKAPVILIPGITEKWSSIKHLGDHISLAGHPVYIIQKLHYNLFDIPESAQKILDSLRNYSIKNAVIVAHSKGGLIGKYLLIHHNHNQQIKGLVAIATPFSGSRMAHLIPHRSFKELRVDSQIIKELKSHISVNKKIISIIPEFDNHVWAEEGGHLDGALDNIVVPVLGHHKILFDKDVQDKVMASIEQLSDL